MEASFTIDVPRSESLDDYLTHFYVVCVAGEDVAVGEAGAVRQISPNKWQAQVCAWLISSLSGRLQVYHGVFADVRWRTVEGPEYRLVPKKQFTGRLLGLD